MRPRVLGFVLTVAVALCPAPSVSSAQQAEKVYRIMFLGASAPALESRPIAAFRQGLRDLGYIEGQNIVTECRWAEGRYDRYPALVEQAANLKVDVVVTEGTPAAMAARDGKKTIPIVMAVIGDPIAAGVVSRVAVVWNPANPNSRTRIPGSQAAARTLRLTLEVVGVGDIDQLEKGFGAIAAARSQVLMMLSDLVLLSHRERIVEFAAKRRLPGLYAYRELVEAGGVASYAPSCNMMFRRAAACVDKILKGAKPADLPVEQPTTFEFVINLKTAKALGLTIPQSVLGRVDEVIQ